MIIKGSRTKPVNRLVLLNLPKVLSLDSTTAWRRWQGIGRPLKLDFGASGQSKPFELLVAGIPTDQGAPTGGPLEILRVRAGSSAADVWLVDAGRSLVDFVLGQKPTVPFTAQATML